MSSFSFTVPGQPISWNAAYRIGNRQVRDRVGAPAMGSYGQPVRQHGMFKTSEAASWQDGIRLIARAARPSWFVVGRTTQLIVAYDFVLAHDIDCDNVMKLMNDALALALGINDKVFMPVVQTKVIGDPKPYTRVCVYDASAWEVQIVAK